MIAAIIANQTTSFQSQATSAMTATVEPIFRSSPIKKLAMFAPAARRVDSANRKANKPFGTKQAAPPNNAEPAAARPANHPANKATIKVATT
jgi:hypothetical protein